MIFPKKLETKEEKRAVQTEPPLNKCYFQNAAVTFSFVANLKG